MPQRLAASTRNFADAIFDFLPDATIVIDTDGKVIAWNKAMETLTGVSAASMIEGDYEYGIPFYKKRRPILANLVFLGPWQARGPGGCRSRYSSGRSG